MSKLIKKNNSNALCVAKNFIRRLIWKYTWILIRMRSPTSANFAQRVLIRNPTWIPTLSWAVSLPRTRNIENEIGIQNIQICFYIVKGNTKNFQKNSKCFETDIQAQLAWIWGIWIEKFDGLPFSSLTNL